jgi:hypothetical protein
MSSKRDLVTSRADVTCRIVQYEAQNSMSIGNLAIVFGPTLFPPTAPHGANGQDGLVGATIQNKVRQILPPRKWASQSWSYLSRRLRPFSNTTPTYSSMSLMTHELSISSPLFIRTSTYITILASYNLCIPFPTVSSYSRGRWNSRIM